ncbi:nuclear transport factor 2 family protein [Nonomuraea pusilla]|uniref:nuclear transport factor 2 family protein n=1 Tax=Nonomuraea pusilla TaxID=46177 RepID=UPI00333011A8
MPSDDKQIRALVERWAEAVHAGDLDGVLDAHAGDIVMFDVTPPYEGVRGLAAYRDTWPGFFAWQAAGASFEIETLEVTAGEDVAFAHALLRCGTEEEFAANPGNRLRLTLGLRKEGGRWVVAHEHHSFPYVAADPAPGVEDDRRRSEEEVRAVFRTWSEGTAAKDLDGMMAAIAPDVVSYEQDPPLRHTGVEAVRRLCARHLEAAGEALVTLDVPDLTVVARDDVAVAWGLDRVEVVPPDGEPVVHWSRGTRVFQRRDGAWLMIHQHLSVPHDPETGEARTGLRP